MVKTSNKFQIVFGKKPRASKTSKRLTICGLDFFIHVSSGETRGNINLYSDNPPYPLVACFVTNDIEFVIKWIEKKIHIIKERLLDVDKIPQIPKDMFKKVKKA